MEHPSASSHWAKLSATHLARFGELTKREIQVVCALFLSRNGKNNRCNPKRKTIGILTGLARSHISIAIAGLESKGWICEMPDGEFVLFDADDIPEPVQKSCGNVEKVTKMVTRRPLDAVEVVTNSETFVTDSATESYQNGNSHKKDSEQSLNSEGTEKARAPAKKIKRKSKATRIPDPFDLTDEMIDWCKTKVPLLRVAEAHADFVEYWTNNQTKKAFAVNWRLRWEKGMRLLLKWQIRDDRQNGKTIIDPDCEQCHGTGREKTTLESWPCPVCLPTENRRYWKSRGK